MLVYKRKSLWIPSEKIDRKKSENRRKGMLPLRHFSSEQYVNYIMGNYSFLQLPLEPNLSIFHTLFMEGKRNKLEVEVSIHKMFHPF